MNVSLLIVRFFLGILLLPNGYALITSYHQSMLWLTGGDFQLPVIMAYLIIVTQFYAIIVLSLGFANRYLASIILFYSLLSLPHHYFKEVEYDWLGQQIGAGILFHMIILGLCLILIIKGGGAISISHVIRKALNFRM